MMHKNNSLLTSSLIATPLGTMIAVADDNGLYLLEFTDSKNIDYKLKLLKNKINPIIKQGSNSIIDLITRELHLYFAGTLKNFTTPLHFTGSQFQLHAWKFLTTVPYGKTCTYLQEAITMGDKKACRAVGHANSKNNLAIIVPCHRVIATSGKLCGYAGGLNRKEWLIKHEQRNML